MTASELRKRYIQFFKEKDHAVIPSASLIPQLDPTVLFMSAGMQPLVPFLLGQPHPQGTRLVNVQKCIRTDDIDEVGDTFHLTFFEMLGNWSLGDYWKREAIEMAMEFLTNPKTGLGLKKQILHITVFEGDDQVPFDEEAASVWEELGISRDQIHPLPYKDNWWALGDTGPQGPDTEIFVDIGTPLCSDECRPGCGCEKFVEIWNLVFMSYDRSEDGTLTPLEKKNIDTGMGLERALQVLNKLPSVFETGVFKPIMDKIREITKISDSTPEQMRSMRIIADHIRSAVMALADDQGLVPSNVERGYVIRRLLRVAIRQGLQLGIEDYFLKQIVPEVFDILGKEYDELLRNKTHVLNEIEKEEKRFRTTVRRGLRIAERTLKEKGILTGKDAFMLFATYGFPIEMTVQIAEENGQKVDLDEFRKEFEKHQQISRDATQHRFTSGLADHSEEVIQLHTATHLLHTALHRFIGSSVYQKGSNITKERLRLDVQLNRKLTPEELQQIEEWVNKIIQRDLPVTFETMTPEEAQKQGALGFFVEKYGEHVKVYSVGDVSKEICSGPHVENTGLLGTFRVVKQKRIGADTLRLRAVLEQKD
ncbi:MAG: alanine--tRNA ligase [Candidatus Hermodarchaeota archaeon]|nr:alanine--tRNA ligase [Candidatus Hermodarchaeota archaeon]